jgi:hypothetical protein
MLENIIPIIPTEITAEHADRTQIGAFAQSTRFTAHLDETGIGLSLERRGALTDSAYLKTCIFITCCFPTSYVTSHTRPGRSRPTTSRIAMRYAIQRGRFTQRSKPIQAKY